MSVDHTIDYRNARRQKDVVHREKPPVKPNVKAKPKLIDDDLKPMNEKLVRNFISKAVLLDERISATKIKEQLDEDGYRTPSLVLISGVRSHVVQTIRWLREQGVLSKKAVERLRAEDDETEGEP